MTKRVTVFTLPGCSVCKKATATLSTTWEVEEISAELDSLLTLDPTLRESVMSEIEWRDGAVPVFVVDGKVLAHNEEVSMFPEIFSHA